MSRDEDEVSFFRDSFISRSLSLLFKSPSWILNNGSKIPDGIRTTSKGLDTTDCFEENLKIESVK